MNTYQMKLIRESWKSLEDNEDAFAIGLIAKIKKHHIKLLRIVNVDLRQLSEKIVSIMHTCISNLERQHLLLVAANEIADCCEEYDIDEEIIYSVRSLLVDTLQDVMAEQLTEDIQQAWERAFDKLFALTRMSMAEAV